MALLPWKIIESKYLIKDRWMTLRADRCELADGRVVDPYYVQEPCDWAHVVAFDERDNVLITRQYRHGAQTVCTELPCGGVEPGEDPFRAIERELLEETGCRAARWEALPSFSPNPARYANKVYPFVAFGTACAGPQALDEAEEIEFEFVAIPRLLELIDSGEFSQPLHIATLFLALRHRKLVNITVAGGQ